MNERRPFDFTRRDWLQAAALAASFPLAAMGAQQPDLLLDRDLVDEDLDDDDKKYKTKIETILVGDKTTFAGLEPVVLEGVGLVRGLSGTGGDPAPSQFRTALMEDLKQRSYKNPNAILQSPDTALVVVRAYLPPLLKKGERLDVEIRVPESAEASSLLGGELMEVRLSDRAIVNGTYMTGRVYAVARGPVLTAGLGAAANTDPSLLKRGRVIGGAVVERERELALFLKNDFRSVRNAQRISDVIGRRFHHFDEHGIKKPMATAKTDQRIVLKVHPRYKDNYPRYLQVIRHLAFRETPVELRVRMNRLQHDLFVPETASSSAFQLEAIGSPAIPILKQGLLAPTLECRFHAAVSLAYLGESTGLAALVESAKKEPAFRVFALAAMSAFDDAEAHIALRDLMNESTDETRYGAFRALWTLDRNDPFIRAERLGVREDAEDHDNEYALHALKTSGPSLVHVTLRTRPEVVIFGHEQEFSAPMYLSAGKHIMLTAQPGATTVSLARFEVGKPDQRKESSLRVADVIRAADELGATYPDILQMLADASKQKNVATPVAADKLPEAGRPYYRQAINDKSKGSKVKIGRPNFTPNIFPEVDDPEEAARRKEDAAREAKAFKPDGPMASVPSETAPANGPNSDADAKADSNSKPEKTSQSRKSEDKPKSSWSWFNRK